MNLSTRRLLTARAARAARVPVLAACVAAGVFVPVVVTAQSDSQQEVQDLRITVQSGDTFSDIVTREMKSYDAWGEIARYNKLESPDDLKPGDVIIIPAQVLRLRNYATVIFVKGTAVHHNSAKGTKGNISKGDKIYAGDLIETAEDGFVSVSFNGGSSVNIQPDSTMKINVLECIDREDACQIKLRSEKGALGLDVKSSGFEKPTVFIIDSPYASAAVRGTSFDFDINDGNALGVTEGTVQIQLNGSGLRNDIEIGKGVLAGEGKSINDLIDLLADPAFKLNDDITRVSSQDVINWDPVSGAVNYLIAYDTNESMQSVVTSLTETKTFNKPDLPAGDYYVSGRAVDSNGLRGFVSKKRIRSIAIDPQLESPELDVQLVGAEMTVIASGSPSDNIEVKIGNSVTTVDGIEYVLGEEMMQVKGGDSITVSIDPAQPWYVQGRKVTSNRVSSYGLLYIFEKSGG